MARMLGSSGRLDPHLDECQSPEATSNGWVWRRPGRQTIQMADTDLLLRMASDALDLGDFLRARELYTRGAHLGDALCWHSLGYMHDTGEGGDIDTAAALRLYRRAFRMGVAASANNIAIIYRDQGNRRAMFRWFSRAAEHGDIDAHLQLARCYRDGLGVRRSISEMIRWARMALRDEYATDEERTEIEEMLRQQGPRSL